MIGISSLNLTKGSETLRNNKVLSFLFILFPCLFVSIFSAVLLVFANEFAWYSKFLLIVTMLLPWKAIQLFKKSILK